MSLCMYNNDNWKFFNLGIHTMQETVKLRIFLLTALK